MGVHNFDPKTKFYQVFGYYERKINCSSTTNNLKSTEQEDHLDKVAIFNGLATFSKGSEEVQALKSDTHTMSRLK